MRIGLANMSDGDGSLAAALPSPSSSPAAAPPSSTTNFTHNTPKSWTRLELVVVMLAGAAVFDWLFSFLLFDDAAYAELSSFDERMFMLVLRVVCAAVGACLALSAVTVRVIVPLVREARALKEAKRSAEALRAARKAWRKAHGVSRQTAEDDGGGGDDDDGEDGDAIPESLHQRILEALVCPITRVQFVDPVIAGDGHTYEREAIEMWLSSGHATSPMTGLPLPKPLLLLRNWHAKRLADVAHDVFERSKALKQKHARQKSANKEERERAAEEFLNAFLNDDDEDDDDSSK